MPYLFCQEYGPKVEASTIGMQDELRQLGESVLLVEGTLSSGPWRCDSCNAVLIIGSRAWLKSSFPNHFHDHLVDYDFGYELNYFAMTPADRVAAYGAEWPDDSLEPCRIAESIAEERQSQQGWVSATELFAK